MTPLETEWNFLNTIKEQAVFLEGEAAYFFSVALETQGTENFRSDGCQGTF